MLLNVREVKGKPEPGKRHIEAHDLEGVLLSGCEANEDDVACQSNCGDWKTEDLREFVAVDDIAVEGLVQVTKFRRCCGVVAAKRCDRQCDVGNGWISPFKRIRSKH